MLATGLGLLAAPRILRAQGAAFGSRPIEIVTHSGVGGGTDITARMVMVHAPAEFGTELVVVNKTGGSGAAALAYAAQRPKDGHTLLLMTQTHLITMLRSKTGTQLADLVGVARATEDPQVVMVRADSPLRSVDEFLSTGKSRALKFGITHVGSVDHVATVGFAKAAGIRPPTAVPFRGGGDIVINLVGGNIDAGLLNFAEAEAQIRAGEVRPLMVLSDERVSSLPDTPTAKETKIDYSSATTRGFAVMKGTPEDWVARLEQGLLKSMASPTYTAYLKSSGQASTSPAGRAVWQAQLEAFSNDSRQALADLGVAQ
ncbi:tripartite tricarboxylate transporter substrate binding protein [Roseomonas marmotae]|uniref:Tripartite tricarboxylate transporter substrate binding protein n=1 Tax=Roseomonas marmotae TaxID=2768161 RepID=A0ABS3KAU5_9PROT|nr:tripartite tricarboxylate transporter substrate binding protein [Roseomonas marmotae]MBO1074569.1 tripartite tricarboxylate transporter substrate binding protein [Roseomonas marmotae]QTI81600.1 tripartite tricarboxylate transporter substrate binding protein [Roseomonas marmotae]